MKKNIYKIIQIFAFLVVTGLVSCTEYLDRSPEAEVSSTDAFINFTNFQGFTEELYCCVPDFATRTWATDWNMGDEVLHKDGGIWLNDLFDKGDYWGWTTQAWISWLDKDALQTLIPVKGKKGYGLMPGIAIRKPILGWKISRI